MSSSPNKVYFFKFISNPMSFIICLIISYLIGSVSCAILVAKLAHLPDPRTHGSKNPGATNVLRLSGKKYAALVLLGDMLKGVLPVLLARGLGLSLNSQAWVGIVAILGHIYPIYFRFEGGKGIATVVGALLALSMPLGFSFIGCWLIVSLMSGYSSLGSIIATLIMPIFTAFWAQPAFWPMSFIALLLLYRHRHNIQRLIKGTESKLNFKKDKS